MPRAIVRPLSAALACAGCIVIGLSGCSRGEKARIASGVVDSAALFTTGAPPAAGPGVQVTRTDGKSVTRSTELALTDDDFRRFMAAADSIVAIDQRDSSARNYLAQNITDAGSTTQDAGIKWLQGNDSVSHAIASAGMTPADYFVESLAIAAAERFMANPKDAPPTPALSKNAAFLRGHTADLDRLRAERTGKPVVTATP